MLIGRKRALSQWLHVAMRQAGLAVELFETRAAHRAQAGTGQTSSFS
jgi:hypothetical protein